jgi:hypothetical protein
LLNGDESAKLAGETAGLKRIGAEKAMKFNIEIDCTPEEARRLVGLPDVTPLHDIYLDRVKELMSKGITPDMVEAMVKNWVPMGESGLNMLQSMFGQFGGGLMRGARKPDDNADEKPARGRKN